MPFILRNFAALIPLEVSPVRTQGKYLTDVFGTRPVILGSAYEFAAGHSSDDWLHIDHADMTQEQQEILWKPDVGTPQDDMTRRPSTRFQICDICRNALKSPKKSSTMAGSHERWNPLRRPVPGDTVFFASHAS